MRNYGTFHEKVCHFLMNSLEVFFIPYARYRAFPVGNDSQDNIFITINKITIASFLYLCNVKCTY